ncbi:MAG: hypothetical protein GXO75_20380 [Calditrichaeota bacterium]|nr:hypothetical protein [Calditrichota bacterium]
MKNKLDNLMILLTAQWLKLETGKKRLVQILGLIILLIILKNAFVPGIKHCRELAASINESEDKLHIAQAELSSFAQVRETEQRYARKLDSLSFAFSDKLDLSLLLPLAAHKVNILKFEPRKTQRSEGFTKTLIDLKVSGNYKEIVEYMKFIENAKIVSTLDSFTIAPYPANPKQTLAKIALSVFSGPKADTTLIFPSFGDKENSEKISVPLKSAGFISFSGSEDEKKIKPKKFRHARTKFTVTGVWLGKVTRLAINGQVIKEKDVIRGWRLDKIDREHRTATLVRNGTRQVLAF